jgi:hypothetical protein
LSAELYEALGQELRIFKKQEAHPRVLPNL